MSQHRKFVHLAIDWNQARNASCRSDKATQEATAYAADLRQQHVPTLWVVYVRDAAFYPAEQAWQPDNDNLRSANTLGTIRPDLAPLRIRQDESIWAKGHINAFCGGQLDQILREEYSATDLLVSGGLTSVCVETTLKGGTMYGYNMHAVSDRLFCTSPWDADPAAHRSHLQKEWLDAKAMTLPGRPDRQPVRHIISAQESLALVAKRMELA